MLLLTTTGARSGQARTAPPAHTMDGDSYVVIASKAGADHHPSWFHNLVAHPDVTVECATSGSPPPPKSRRSRSAPASSTRGSGSCPVSGAGASAPAGRSPWWCSPLDAEPGWGRERITGTATDAAEAAAAQA